MGKKWSFYELERLFTTPILELIYQAAKIHHEFHPPGEVQVCHLISIKTGGCTEDCKYCAQSAYYKTPIKATSLMDLSEIISKASAAKARGATRICLGIGQREVKEGRQFEQVLEIIKTLNALKVEVCCTFGMVGEEFTQRLKEAGAYAYNHNLDTSREYYPKIITTRTYDDRLKTLDIIEKIGLQVCCGGIIGLGEKREDRINLLLELANRDPYPESVPINLLSQVRGTPLEKQEAPPKWEAVRMIATARICMPKSVVRLSAGRDRMTTEMQAFCFLAGVNSIFIGEKCFTVPNPSYDADDAMFEELGLRKREGYGPEIRRA